ncbi:MAG: hypothetical protein K8953_04110, partial [Proteobacteria bacterium]|nr:hypothetical protein [Pseudomonadota bacterium]
SIEGGVVERVLSGFTDQFHVAGTYDAGGVITGTVTYAGFGGTNAGQLAAAIANGNNGAILTGLIGAQGAVGVFLRANADSTKDNILDAANTTDGYVGGFVAAPAPPPRVATHANFKTYYADAARANNRRLLATPTTTTATAAFVEGTTTGLDMTGLAFTAANTFAPVTIRLKEAATGDDGFAIMYGVTTDGSNGIYRAGLLSMTDLGPAVPTTGMASWSGTIYSSINLTSGVPASIPLDLTVNFTDGEINTTTPASYGTSTITVKGRFGSAHGLDDGILGGTVDYNVANSLQANALPLIGLIGTKGVIGVFHGDGKLTAVGGFQASPN